MIMSDERSYRAYCYFQVADRPAAEAIRVESARLPFQHAIDLLSVLSTSGDYQGGGIEHHLPGIGWSICEDETECPDQGEGD
jgi:hypothetical protein